MKTTLPSVLVATLLCLAALACGGGEEEVTESADPIVGLMELPISHRSVPNGLSNAIRIEIGPTRLRLDGSTIVELENGWLPDAARNGNSISALAAGIAAGPARRSAELSLHGSARYITTALVLSTLKAANVGEVAFAVRGVGEPTPGFLVLNDYLIRDQADELYEFPDAFMPPWGTVATNWADMYSACRENHYVDCSFKPNTIAEGGRTHITMFARGNGVQIELHRVGDPVPDPNAAPALEMLEGVPAPASEEVIEQPATHAGFTWRYNATTDAESPVTGTMRPLCGATSCGVLITSQGQTPMMRILSFLGAAFPNGTEAPKVVFQIPPE